MPILTPGEEQVMKDTFRAAMLRAADIIDRITQNDVVDAQMALLATGVRLQDLAKIDRALVASCHLRSCVALHGDAPDETRARQILDDMKERVKA
jgi:hypothetical protein